MSCKNAANSKENIFNPFDFQHILNNDNSKPDIKFFNDKFDVVDPSYFSLEEIPCKVEKFLENFFSVFHVNMRSSKKNFEKLVEFLSIMKNAFDVRTTSETWWNDDSINVNHSHKKRKDLPLSCYYVQIHFIKYQIIFLSIKLGKLVIRVEG